MFYLGGGDFIFSVSYGNSYQVVCLAFLLGSCLVYIINIELRCFCYIKCSFSWAVNARICFQLFTFIHSATHFTCSFSNPDCKNKRTDKTFFIVLNSVQDRYSRCDEMKCAEPGSFSFRVNIIH